MKSQAEAFIVWSRERIDALKIDVVADHDEATLHKFALDASGGVGEDYSLHSHARENADRKRYFFRGIAFIKMDAALHARYWNCADFSNDELPRVADGRGLREMRNFPVRNFGGIGELVCESTEA